MEKSELKQMLAKSKQEPLSCAMGKGKDAKTAYLVMHKTKQPQKLRAEICAEFEELKDPRWGTAFVDTEVDPKLVIFRINKPSQGLAKRIAKLTKQVGYPKVRFEFDDGSEAESEYDEEEGGEGLEVQSDEAAEQRPEAITLRPRLADALKAIMAATQLPQARKFELVELAKAAQGLMNANDFAGTLSVIEQLEVAIGELASSQPPVSPPAGSDAFTKSRQIWQAVRKQMQGDVDKLQQSLADAYSDSPLLGQIQTSYDERVVKKLAPIDDALATLLDDVTKAVDANTRAAKVQAAREKIAEYQNFMAAEAKFFEDLDSNPFVPVAIGAVLTKSLAALSATVR